MHWTSRKTAPESSRADDSGAAARSLAMLYGEELAVTPDGAVALGRRTAAPTWCDISFQMITIDCGSH